MSDLYRKEVPMYGSLVDMVETINHRELERQPAAGKPLIDDDKLKRLSAERHGAIRVGTAAELSTIRRLFAVMGMYPVSYYDLTEAGIPVHSTAFRPIDQDELSACPFRIFTSLLRLDLVKDSSLKKQAQTLLNKRQIFTKDALQLIQTFEQQKGLTENQASDFVNQALQTFRWHRQANVDLQTYERFLHTHSLLADIVCFKGPHINHLTPRTLNIDHAQQQMGEYGLDAKAIIEGPPKRAYPILLRQTSFKALTEKVEFLNSADQTQPGSHSARFGEIEERGMALTPKGRALYDLLLNEVRQVVVNPEDNIDEYYRQLEIIFKRFPDDIQQIRQQGLAYFRYSPGSQKTGPFPDDLDSLIDKNLIHFTPITYEDFLPVSAAGIFRSNLAEGKTRHFSRSPNQQAFERDLGCAVINEFEHYAGIQRDSLQGCVQRLGMNQKQQATIVNQVSD